jgi:hypothetical protein
MLAIGIFPIFGIAQIRQVVWAESTKWDLADGPEAATAKEYSYLPLTSFTCP